MGSGGPRISHNVRSQIAWAAAGAGEKAGCGCAISVAEP